MSSFDARSVEFPRYIGPLGEGDIFTTDDENRVIKELVVTMHGRKKGATSILVLVMRNSCSRHIDFHLGFETQNVPYRLMHTEFYCIGRGGLLIR